MCARLYATSVTRSLPPGFSDAAYGAHQEPREMIWRPHPETIQHRPQNILNKFQKPPKIDFKSLTSKR